MMSLRWLLETNLFETNETDNTTLRIQRWSTRLYVLTFGLIMLILSVYAALHTFIVQIEIQNPSVELYQEVQNKHSLECICSHDSTRYGDFIQLRPIYHQICTSDFVKQEWIEYLFDLTKTSFYFPADFRASASQQFQLLSMLCRITIEKINDDVNVFYQIQFLNDKLMSENYLSTEINSRISALKRNILDTFNHKLMFSRQFISGNYLLTSVGNVLGYSYRHFVFNGYDFWPILFEKNGFFQPNGKFCSCDNSSTCYGKAGIFGDHLYNENRSAFDYLYIVDGWFIGCRPIDSLFLSTLNIFYHQTIINTLLNFFTNSSTNFTCLDESQATRFNPSNTTLETIIKSNFIESWTQQINYSAYFYYCAPKSCTYALNKRFYISYILTAIIGLYGGLSMLLRILVPFIVKYLLKNNRENSRGTVRLSQPKELIHFWYRQLTHNVLNLNLFRSSTHVQSTDIYQQRWSTRLYLILFSLILVIVTIYTTISKQTISVDLKNPSLNDLLKLQLDTSISHLECPCSKISSSFQSIIELNPIYHQICFSDFISDSWISQVSNPFGFRNTEFRLTGSIFQLLQSFCKLANVTVINSLNVFYETELVTVNLLTYSVFMSQMSSHGINFQLVTPTQFSYPLQIQRETMHANQFISGGSSSVYLLVVQNNTGHLTVNIDPMEFVAYDNGSRCLVRFDGNCKINTVIDYQVYENYMQFIVPGFYTSAYYVESLMQSQTVCLYDQSCIDSVVELAYLIYKARILSEPSRFPKDSTFALLSNNLFIESWSQKLNYTAYFQQCHPYSCSYIVTQRPSFVLILTTVIGISSGLSLVIHIISPFITKFILTRLRKIPSITSTEQIEQQENRYDGRYVARIWRKLIDLILTQNIFENVDKPNPPEEELRAQRYWTRTYILLQILILNIIFLSTFIAYQTNTIIVNKPTLDLYKTLPKSVECPCTNLSIPYNSFIHLKPLFYDACWSIYIIKNGIWMTLLKDSYIYQTQQKRKIHAFQTMGALHFQSLQIMCELVSTSVNDETNLFLNSTFISIELIDFDLFEKEMNSTISNLLFHTIPSKFLNTFNLIQSLYIGNGLMTSLGTNWYPVIADERSTNGTIYMQAQQYNQSSCNCATSTTCTEPMVLELDSQSNWTIPGMLIGCLPFESMLQSTLECIYDQNCLNMICETMNFQSFPALQAYRTRFQPIKTTKIQSIANELFIENWNVNISYENYFYACQPTSCSYTLEKRFNILYSIGIILTIFSGFSLVLRILIPFGFKIVRQISVRSNRQVHPLNIF